MTAKNLLNIILKVIGIFFLRDFLIAIPQIFSLISLLINYSEGSAISPFVAALLSVGGYGFISYMLIFRTNRVIEILKLTDGFDEGILPLNIHRAAILNIAVIVTGSLLVIYAIPSLFRQIFLFFQYQRERSGLVNMYPRPDNTIIIIYITEIIIGLLMLGSHRRIVNYIELKRKTKTSS